MKIVFTDHYQELPSYFPGFSIYRDFCESMSDYKNNSDECLKDFPIWKVLLALHKIECNHIAYLSLQVSIKDKTWYVPSHIQVELWTEDKKIIFQPPLNAKSFYDGCNVSDFFSKEKIIDQNWVDFFKMKILEAKEKIKTQIGNLEDRKILLKSTIDSQLRMLNSTQEEIKKQKKRLQKY